VPRAVATPFVAAHHTDGPEADLLVAPDRAVVVGCGIDHQAMVPPLEDEVTGQRANRVGSEALILPRGRDPEVDACVPVLRVDLLSELGDPDDQVVERDREDDCVRGAVRLRPEILLVEIRPPPGECGLAPDPDERRDVGVGKRPQHDSVATQLHPEVISRPCLYSQSVKKRLDVLLVERGLAETRSQAQALVIAGLVPGYDKPGTQLDESVPLEVERPPRFVSRGGEKLAHALELLGVDPAGRDCLDVGASTGGFTDCLLQNGAARVIALDVGYGQLHPRLRSDDRVTVLERVNARSVTSLPFAPELIVCDVSFISVKTALPPLLRLAAPGWQALVLVKPQFEAGRADVPKGVVRDPDVRRRVLRDVCGAAARWGSAGRGSKVVGIVDSGLPGPKGNREFVVHLIDRPEPTDANELECWIDHAVG